ncbi:hypothetical protein QWJ07_31350 [Frankia sp. RB7]|nr:hypothetical protein [Frankia sp. RB7]
MAWKWVSDDNRRYCINLDRVDYIVKLDDGRCTVSFGDGGNKLTVNQPPGKILGGEEVTIAYDGGPQPGDPA